MSSCSVDPLVHAFHTACVGAGRGAAATRAAHIATRDDHSDFGIRNAPCLELVAVSVRLLVFRTSQRFASPPTSRSVHPVGGDPGSSDALTGWSDSRCAVHALRARRVARDAMCGVDGAGRHGRISADRVVARNAVTVERYASVPLAERLPDAARCEARSASCRTQPVMSAEREWTCSGSQA